MLYLPKVWGSRIWNIILTVFLWWQRQRQRHNFMHFLRGDYFSGLNFFQGWIYEFRTVYLVKFPSLFSFFCLFVVVAANSESGLTLTCPSLSGPECTLLNNHNVTYINIYNFIKNRLVKCFFIDCLAAKRLRQKSKTLTDWKSWLAKTLARRSAERTFATCRHRQNITK